MRSLPLALVVGAICSLGAQERYPGLVRIEASDPTVGPGFAGAANELLYRTDLPSVYYKTSAVDTAWTQIGASAAASQVTTASALLTFLEGPIINTSLHFDGTSIVDGVTPVGGVYTLTLDLSAQDVTIDPGVTIACQQLPRARVGAAHRQRIDSK